MSVLIDSSVWVDHFRRRNDRLVDLIVMDLGLTHPMIVGELACGTPPAPRLQTLSDIELLRPVTPASVRETIEFIEREKLYGLGCGLVDMILPTSTLITPGATPWTLDKRLATLAERFEVAHRPGLH
ncbi:type II toxin-antitoxin system VapC family toxin [Zoogloea ramigera]|uniref:type II toxin-antitoxin system VapC family toxin n=1 Tax=Zoogloea ramigera TaxID=350 RepID=UPI003FA2596D